MSLREAVSNVFRNYVNFKGRARRKEVWMFTLFNILVFSICTTLSAISGVSVFARFFGNVDSIWDLFLFAYSKNFDDLLTSLIGSSFFLVLGFIYMLVALIPTISLLCRRLHDCGISGAYLVLAVLPIVGPLLLFIWKIQDSQAGPNQYGPDPKNRDIPGSRAAYISPSYMPTSASRYVSPESEYTPPTFTRTSPSVHKPAPGASSHLKPPTDLD